MQRLVYRTGCHLFARRGFGSTGFVRLSMAAAIIVGGFLVAGVNLLGAAPATAASTTWYAYALGEASSPTSCPETTTTSDECTLTQALGLAIAGDTVALATSGAESTPATYYVGNFTVATGTSGSPLTVEPASGVTDPILDGNSGSSSGCPTTVCDGPVLTIFSGRYVTIENITIQDADNTATSSGGGIFSNGTATLTNDTFSEDSVDDYGAGFYNNGTATLTGDTFSGDSAGYYGGGVFNTGTVTLTGDTLSDDSADAHGGGGVYNEGTATLTNDTLSGDTSTDADGGGVYNNGGTVTLTDDTLSGDTAPTNGGGVYNDGGTATLTSDTLSGDMAEYGAGVFTSGTATLTNDTLSGESATYGGGVYNSNTATLTNDTLSKDTATYGGGVYNEGTAPSISNSILAASSCWGTVTDGGYNVESDNTCGLGTDDVVGSTTIHLGSSLAANGSTGPETLAIGTNSSAFEEVPNAACTPTKDERGDTRPGIPGENCDAGAFEYQQGTPTTPTISNFPTSGTYGGGFTATVSTTGDGTKSVTSNSKGVCSVSGFTVSYVGIGTCRLTAHVALGTGFAAANGTAQTFSVGRATTKTVLKLSAKKVTYGHEQAEHLSVTVSPQHPGTTPTGTVTVKTPTGALCAITLSSGKGSHALSAKRLKVGTYHLVATYGGSSKFASSASATGTLTIVK